MKRSIQVMGCYYLLMICLPAVKTMGRSTAFAGSMPTEWSYGLLLIMESTSRGVMPIRRKDFCLLRIPEVRTTDFRLSENFFAKNFSMLLLAAPSTGGAWTFIFRRSP